MAEEKKNQMLRNFMGINVGTMEELRNRHVEAIMNMKEDDNRPTGEEVFNEMLPFFKQAPSWSKLLNISDGQVEGIYNMGYQAYNQGKYEEAVSYFRVLYMLCPANEKYMFSLGLALERQRKFYEAATAYLYWSLLEQDKPLGYFRAGICFLEMEDQEAADDMFKKAIEISGDDDRYLPIKERSVLFRIGIRTTIGKQVMAEEEAKKKQATSKEAKK